MTITRRALLTLGGIGVAVGCGRTLGERASLPARPPALPAAGHPDPYRLPRSVVPERYEIQVEPDLRAFTFTGEETVDLTVHDPVREIVLNAAELEIRAVSIRNGHGTELAGALMADEATEQVRLLFPETLRPGRWRLTLSFAGILNDHLRGFYRTRVTTAGRESVLALTQFQSTDARRAFPCWDEPAFKAVFRLRLVIDEHLTAISNTAVVAERPIPGTGRKLVSFAPTIRMSTYLVAFVIGELESTAVTWVGEAPLRIWCLPGKKHLTRFAREVAAFALRFCQEYYGIRYPGDKLDLIAVPDLDAAAMENLGAITFRETALLVDEPTATRAELERVADQVAHEIAHMWFGDLVTMTWWNGLWLNEAFATFMQMLAVDAWRPAWERWTTFSVARSRALEVDGLTSTRPIEFAVVAPKDADAMFDAITYEKGAAVLRMLEQYLGSAVFRRGVRRYLERHRFANAETADLWRALGKVSTQPISTIMDRWVFHPGYPVVTVRAGDDGRTLTFSQRRFTYLGDGAGDPGHWHIPVTFRASVDGRVQRLRLLLSSAEAQVALPGLLDWAVVNESGWGFYRVRYDTRLVVKLVTRARDILTPAERFSLVNDAWASALAGLGSVAEYLDLTERFRDETDRHVWAALLASFASLGRAMASRDRTAFEHLVRDRLGPSVGRLGWAPQSGESALTRQLRGDLLRALATFGEDEPTQARGRGLYARYRDDPSAVDPDVALALLAIVAHTGDARDYEEFLEKLKTARTPQEERRYLFMLAGFRDPALIRRTLGRVLAGEVRTQDAPLLIRTLLQSVDAREFAWEFVKEHWGTLARRYPPSGLTRMCEGITGLATRELEADVRRFFASREITLGGRVLEQYLEQLGVAVVFGEREAGTLRAYLSRFAPGG